MSDNVNNILKSSGELMLQAEADNDVKAAEIHEEQQKIRKRSLIKLAVLLLLLIAVLLFATIAWFTMNKETGTNGMGVKVQGTPYTIMTRNESGYYKDKWDMIGSDAIEWKISAEHNLDNYVVDPDHITEQEENELGLEPGDSGSLEFRVQPNTSDSITVDCVFDIRAYLERTKLDQQGRPVLDDNSIPMVELVEIDNSVLTAYIKAHILLFAGYDDSTGKYTDLITDNDELRWVLENQRYTKNGSEYTTIYWVWPMYLRELTSNNDEVIIYDHAERSDVIDYIAKKRTGFFKDCTDTKDQVSADLTALSTSDNVNLYNRYSLKYDNADLEIGNNISYIMLSMNVEQ